MPVLRSIALAASHQEWSWIRSEINAIAEEIKRCADGRLLARGASIHREIAGSSHAKNRYLANKLIEMYGKCGNAQAAKSIYNGIQAPNCFSKTMMLSAFLRNGQLQPAMAMFFADPAVPSSSSGDVVLWNTMLQGLCDLGHLDQARLLFDRFPQWNVVSWNALMTAVAEDGDCASAKELFEGMPERDMVSWNVFFFHSCTLNGELSTARIALARAPQHSVVTWTAMITAYSSHGYLDEARSLFDTMAEHNIVTWNAMIVAYTQTGQVDQAKYAFDKMPYQDVISWTAMVTAYAACGHVLTARALFNDAVYRDMVSWNTLLSAYSLNGHFEQGREIFSKAPVRDVVSWNVMVSANAQYGHLEVSRKLFNEMPCRNSVTCNALMLAHAQAGDTSQALEIFERMPQQDITSWNIVLTTYAQKGELDAAQRIFSAIPVASIVTLNAMMAAYAEVGKVSDARHIFDLIMQERNLITWNSMIQAYAQNGLMEDSFHFFQLMVLDGIKPDELTAFAVLTACSYGGKVAEAREHLVAMVEDHGLSPSYELYGFMADIIARSGELSYAEELIASLSNSADSVAWTSLLGACRLQSDIQRGQRVALLAATSDRQDSAPYSLLANMSMEEI
ncbi:pentatricopeptide repeat-containing protein At4g02750-like [Selaginella moellendorffii]|nr:pentatricopeptide repeat-containing protein At4g02750-like [Selaginella moellendorffii]|eukprot:XP_024521379.1 pentatricopeptide repeat-containing protein At4g02750-like [Selaginella moellendorffii]